MTHKDRLTPYMGAKTQMRHYQAIYIPSTARISRQNEVAGPRRALIVRLHLLSWRPQVGRPPQVPSSDE